MYATTNPATGELVQEFPTLSDDEAEAALGHSAEAYRAWSAREKARMFSTR